MLLNSHLLACFVERNSEREYPKKINGRIGKTTPNPSRIKDQQILLFMNGKLWIIRSFSKDQIEYITSENYSNSNRAYKNSDQLGFKYTA